ncbi:MAG: hypothetical protein EOP07_11135 [Proteobacteria bacterium]|nr:MAG: hypothetical protein EOP07_11135 [Pseudomonadota bacterium]
MPTEKDSCPACQKPNLCALSQGLENCWCMAVEPRVPLGEANASCYCQDCLDRIARVGGVDWAKP